MRGRPRAAAADSATTRYRGADGRWHARVTVGRRLDGERDRRHVSRATKRELEAAIRELENARDSGQQPWLLDNVTVEDWLEHWLEEILPLSVRWKTRSGYASHLRVHVIPFIGSMRLTELRPETLERLYRQLIASGRSTHVVHGVHRVLRSSLNEALRRQRLLSNPAALARPPRVERTEIEPLTADECRAVLGASRGRLNAARWSVALALGLRQGEALGLMWDDVDLDAGVLRVRRAVQRRTWAHGCSPPHRREPACGRLRGAECPQRRDGGLVLVEPKTRSSRRSVALPAPLVAELRAHRAAQLRLKLEQANVWDHTTSFSAPTGVRSSTRTPTTATGSRSCVTRGCAMFAWTTHGTPRPPSCCCRASTSAPSWPSWAGPSSRRRSATSTLSTSSGMRPRDAWGPSCGDGTSSPMEMSPARTSHFGLNATPRALETFDRHAETSGW